MNFRLARTQLYRALAEKEHYDAGSGQAFGRNQCLELLRERSCRKLIEIALEEAFQRVTAFQFVFKICSRFFWHFVLLCVSIVSNL